MNGRMERPGDPIIDAIIVILRSDYENDEWRVMDTTYGYHFPNEKQDYYKTINYWIPWDKFIFPSSMILSNQPERSKREDSHSCEMRCSEHCSNTMREAK
jgi:hypothetical protein